MAIIRGLVGTVGVVLGIVLLILGVVLSPVLLLLAPIPLVVYLAWKFWRVRRTTGRALRRPAKEAHTMQKKVRKKAKSLV